MDKEHISVGQASIRLGISKQTVRKWIDEGKLKAFITPGGHRRVFVQEINKVFDNTFENAMKGIN